MRLARHLVTMREVVRPLEEVISVEVENDPIQVDGISSFPTTVIIRNKVGGGVVRRVSLDPHLLIVRPIVAVMSLMHSVTTVIVV